MCEPHAAPTALETGTRPHDWSAHVARVRANHNHTEPCVERRHAERTCKPRLMIGKHGLATVALHEQVSPSASPHPLLVQLIAIRQAPRCIFPTTRHLQPNTTRANRVPLLHGALPSRTPHPRYQKPSNAKRRKACNFRPNVVCKAHRCRGLRVLHVSGVVACRFHRPRPSSWHFM